MGSLTPLLGVSTALGNPRQLESKTGHQSLIPGPLILPSEKRDQRRWAMFKVPGPYDRERGINICFLWPVLCKIPCQRVVHTVLCLAMANLRISYRLFEKYTIYVALNVPRQKNILRNAN